MYQLCYFLILTIAITIPSYFQMSKSLSPAPASVLCTRGNWFSLAMGGRGGWASDVKHVIVTNRRLMGRSYPNVILASRYNLDMLCVNIHFYVISYV